MNFQLHSGVIGQVALPNGLDTMLEDCAHVFEESSSSAIHLHPRLPVLRLAGADTVATVDLHEAAENITGNHPNTAGPVTNIGLLFAGHYAPDGLHPDTQILGLMFDPGFVNGAPPQGMFGHTPREACAVFLNSIAALRPNAQARSREIYFNIIHELGHVFNLGHMSSPLNFMASSPANAPHPVGAHRFMPGHRSLLALCDEEPHIQPGGSEYGDLGTLAPPHGSTYDNRVLHGGRLRLEIGCSQPEFYACEPVELDVSMLLKGKGRPVSVTDKVDPGYDECVVWIEAPSGERCRYKSTKRFCSMPRHRTISNSKPFERDISIFGQSGGYTFKQAGTHRVWMDFELPGKQVLRSNVLELNVLPEVRATAKDKERLVHLRAVGKELFYRKATRKNKGLERLRHVAEHYNKHWTGAACAYALGRALFRAASGFASRSSKNRGMKNASHFLSAAIRHAGLSEHRRIVAERIAKELSGI